jgi:hypothetical protein
MGCSFDLMDTCLLTLECQRLQTFSWLTAVAAEDFTSSLNKTHSPPDVLCHAVSCRVRLLHLQSIFPELHKGCHAFMRHKDILLSPGLLRTYGIEYMQVCDTVVCEVGRGRLW